jgi:biogenesis of lysosome-related organelles complex 1 subunit 2
MAEAPNQPTTNKLTVDGATDMKDSLSEPDEENMNKLCKDMFAKAADYLKGEFDATTEEYRLLEQMNRATITKYAEMKDISTNISIAVKNLDDKYNSLQPYLEMIDQVEESVSNLEQAAYKLDAYSKRLEAKFRQLEKR